MQDTITILKSRPELQLSESFAVAMPSTRPEPLPLAGFLRILLPFDLSRSGICALRVVTDYAERANASVHLVYVVPQLSVESSETRSDRSTDELAESSERMLKQWVKRIVQGRVRTFVSIRMGDPVDIIVARATATRADLIVMTSRSCSGLRNELQRSTAERVSRLAACPVLTIPEKCADQLAYSFEDFAADTSRTILLPVDFSTTAGHALRFASEFGNRTGAKLLLAHGSEEEESENPFVHERVKSWARQILGKPVPCHVAIWPGGHSLYAILSEAVRARAGLIVLPIRSQSWARRLRAGSVTDGVLRQAPCPVLSINDNFAISEN